MERRDRVSTGLNDRRVDDTGGGALALAGTVTPPLNNTLHYVLEFDGSQCVAGALPCPVQVQMGHHALSRASLRTSSTQQRETSSHRGVVRQARDAGKHGEICGASSGRQVPPSPSMSRR